MGLLTFPIKYAAKKVFGEYEIGSAFEDPFFEEVEFEKRSFWSGSTKMVKKRRDKSIPQSIPESDGKVLRRVRKRAYRLDMLFNIGGIRFGWLGVIGILPVVGDFLVLWLSLLVYKEAMKVAGGLPSTVSAQMLSNIALDFGLGLIPFVGDFVSICYKANSRNVLVLERHLKNRYHQVDVPLKSPVPSAGSTSARAPALA
ncbi:LADA_0F12068g1_1 [Lachancea dasiensis]|uniref:LADA_0F12068g1_1 n=1 Tax=Lachancea dasiensis TaxID=1072105 RepID=A0A1G4JMD5_9SACH|nr:LADA_0F12068g1_1 [Lachancea dasiensis]